MTAQARMMYRREGKVIPLQPTDPGTGTTPAGHAWIPAQIVADPTLSPYAFRVYSLIRLHDYGKGQGCFLARAELARLGKMSEAAVVRALRDLRTRGYITTQSSTDGLSTNRHFCAELPPMALVNGCPTDTPASIGGVSQTPEGCQRATPTGVCETPKVNRTEVNELKYYSPSGEGADAPPAAQDHEPRAHNAPTEESLPPARTAAAEPVTEQQEPESAPGLVFEEETAPPALPPPPKARRQSTPAAAPVADTPTLVQARALLATLGVEVTPVTLKAMDGVVEKWAERCEKACGMTLEEKALDVRCWLDGPKGKKQPPTVQRFRNWVQGDTEKAEKAPPLQVVTRQNGNGAPRAAPSPVTDLTAAERKDLEFFAARRARQAAARKAAYDAELAGAEPGGGEA